MPRIDPSQIGRVPSGRRSSTIDDSKKLKFPRLCGGHLD